MSQFAKEYEQFFASPAGESLKQWLKDQREAMHEAAEKTPQMAAFNSMAAKAYGEILSHIESVQLGIGKPSRSSSRTDVE